MVMNPSTDAPDAAALAFGLGGREVAGRELQNWVQAALPGELGAIARGARSLGCAVSLVFLARTREADGERRGCQSPGVSLGHRKRPRAEVRERRVGSAALSAASNPEPANTDLRCHQPHQTSGKRFLESSAVEVLFLRGVERHHPTRMVNVPGAGATAGGNRLPEGVLQGTAC